MKKFWYLSGIFKKPGMSNRDFGMPVQDRGWRLYLRKFRQSIGIQLGRHLPQSCRALPPLAANRERAEDFTAARYSWIRWVRSLL